MLEQLHLESNLHRKTVCVQFLKEAILVHKVNCVNKKLLKVVLLENIHICCNDAVADILLVDVLEVKNFLLLSIVKQKVTMTIIDFKPNSKFKYLTTLLIL